MSTLSVIEQTMSSVEIAELTGKRHDHVMRDVERMLGELEIGAPKFGGTYKSKQGKELKCYNLPKRECIILVSGYNIKMRAAIIDRWQDLEKTSRPSLPDFTNPALAARAWADEVEQKAIAQEEAKQLAHQVEEQTKVIEEQAPAVKAFERIAKTDNSNCIRDTAKLLQIRPIDLTRWLSANRWIYKKPGSAAWIGYQDKVQMGYLEHKTTIQIMPGGEERTRMQVRVTPKGLTKLSKVFNEEAAA